MVILSDATPGGAGYVRRLLEEPRFSARTLLAEALALLDCPRGPDCTTSCNKCLNDYSNQQWWDVFDRHAAARWLEGLVTRSAPRPSHAPEASVPVAPLGPRALGPLIEGGNLLVLAAGRLWGAEEPERAVAGARALRDWLEARPDRVVEFVLSEGETPGSATTADRQAADILYAVARAGRLRFAAISADLLAQAPRLTVKGLGVEGDGLREWYGAGALASALADPGAGVTHRHDASAGWITGAQSRLKEVPSPLRRHYEAVTAHRFSPGLPRDLRPLFDGLAGRMFDVGIQDPYAGASAENRHLLRGFLKTMEATGVEIGALRILWDPHRADRGESAGAQAKGLEGDLVGLGSSLRLEPWNGRGHFHDRIVELREVGGGERVRLDVTSGIDNLMRRNKECKVFVERIA
jgi:hypothetical protein